MKMTPSMFRRHSRLHCQNRVRRQVRNWEHKLLESLGRCPCRFLSRYRRQIECRNYLGCRRSDRPAQSQLIRRGLCRGNRLYRIQTNYHWCQQLYNM